MKDFSSTCNVAGTSAMKPDCSRYSNENECIIDFMAAQGQYSPLAAEGNVAWWGSKTCAHLFDRFDQQAASDLRHSSLCGSSVQQVPLSSMVLAFAAFISMGLVGIILGM